MKVRSGGFGQNTVVVFPAALSNPAKYPKRGDRPLPLQRVPFGYDAGLQLSVVDVDGEMELQKLAGEEEDPATLAVRLVSGASALELRDGIGAIKSAQNEEAEAEAEAEEEEEEEKAVFTVLHLLSSFWQISSLVTALTLRVTELPLIEPGALPHNLIRLELDVSPAANRNPVLSLGSYFGALERCTVLEELTVQVRNIDLFVPSRVFSSLLTLKILELEAENVILEDEYSLGPLPALVDLGISSRTRNLAAVAPLPPQLALRCQTTLRRLRVGLAAPDVDRLTPILGPRHTWRRWTALLYVIGNGINNVAVPSPRWLLEDRQLRFIPTTARPTTRPLAATRHLVPKLSAVLQHAGLPHLLFASVVLAAYGAYIVPTTRAMTPTLLRDLHTFATVSTERL